LRVPALNKTAFRLKIVFALSLVILVVVVCLAFIPRASIEANYTQVAQERLIENDRGYQVLFDILNREGADTQYTIKVRIDEYSFSEDVMVKSGEAFTYGHQIDSQMLTSGTVNFSVFKSGESKAIADINYHLK
jgi:Zn-dependent membrane protease YugP